MAILKPGAVVALAVLAEQALGQNVITSAMIAKMGNNSLFDRWRPRSSYLSPHSWMNDPCGAMYDPITDIYHLGYQYHPKHVSFGNQSWGHSVSKDLFHWTDVRGYQNDLAVSIAPGKDPYAHLSQFTGSMQPINLMGQRNGTLTAFVTSVQHLPTSWQTAYTPGTEVETLYVSNDNGTTWEPYSGNPVIPGPPKGWNITGFRDPFLVALPELDVILEQTEPHYYMVLGSGLKGPNVPAEFSGAARPGYIGPRMPLYSAKANDITKWTFLGALWEPAANSTFGDPDVTGSYGFNFELSGFFPLRDSSGGLHWITGFGAEGGNTTTHTTSHWALWNMGSVHKRDNGSAEFTPLAAGAFDWGITYAHASFNDTKKNRRLVWGWANEDDPSSFAAKQFGYQGAFNLPLELSILETYSVASAPGDELTEKNSQLITQHENGTFTVQTLGLKPAPDVLALQRNGSAHKTYTVGTVKNTSKKIASGLGYSYSVQATLTNTTGICGITIGQSPGNEEYTTVYYNPSNHTIGVNRDHSSTIKEFNSVAYIGHFTPYTIASRTGNKVSLTKEPVNFNIIVDGSLVQVYVNDRFALTSRIYPSRLDSAGVSLFAGSSGMNPSGTTTYRRGLWTKRQSGVTATWTNVQTWKGLAEAWPDRPFNSSTQLVWDTPAETNNYTWWAGYKA